MNCLNVDQSSLNVSVKRSRVPRLITATFKMAYEERNPPTGLVFHSDRGAQYTSHRFQQLLHEHKVQQSFSRPGEPYDNAVTESFFASLKKKSSTEEILLPIEHFKPASLPILSFIIPKGRIEH